MKYKDIKHTSHLTRFSDASTFDEVCIFCGATDISGSGWGKLAEPCPAIPEKGNRRLKDQNARETDKETN